MKKETTPTEGNKVIKKEKKNQKTLNKSTTYSEGAIEYAKKMRGM